MRGWWSTPPASQMEIRRRNFFEGYISKNQQSFASSHGKRRTRQIFKMEEFLTFNATWPWPWIGPHGIQSCITHRPLPTHQISFESEKLFVDGWMDVRTRMYVHTYRQTVRPALLGRVRGVHLKKHNNHLSQFLKFIFASKMLSNCAMSIYNNYWLI